MAALIKILSKDFYILGDGVATSVTLSLSELPFIDKSCGKVVNVEFHVYEPNLSSITFTSKTCTIHFSNPFSGATGPLSLFITYDPS